MQGPQLPAPPQLRHCVYLRQTHATCAMRFIAHAHEAKQGNSAQLKTFESCASMRQCTHLTRHGALSNAALATQHQHHLLHPLQTRPANLAIFCRSQSLSKSCQVMDLGTKKNCMDPSEFALTFEASLRAASVAQTACARRGRWGESIALK